MKPKKTTNPKNDLIKRLSVLLALIIMMIIGVAVISLLETDYNNQVITVIGFISLLACVTISFKAIKLFNPLFNDNTSNDQYHQGRHWTTAEINAGAIQRITQQHQNHEINWLKYIALKHWVLKLYIPKDKSQWGK